MGITDLIKYGGSACGALGVLYGGATFTHDKLQQVDIMEENIVLIDMRLESKILTDRYTLLQQRLWKIEDRYGVDLFEAPGPIKEEYRTIKAEMTALEHEINVVQQEYRRRGSSSNQYYDRSMGKKAPE